MKRNEYSDTNNLQFHYSRGDREKLLLENSKVNKKQTGGYFKRNRFQLIILIDIVVIIIVGFIVSAIIPKNNTKKNIYGCTYSFGFFFHEDTLFTKLKVKQTSKDKELPDTFTIILKDQNNEVLYEGTKTILFSDESDVFYIQEKVDNAAYVSAISVEIKIGDDEFRLSGKDMGID